MDTMFWCNHCGGMGYEDYPHNLIPCRITKHKEIADKNVEWFRAEIITQRKPYKQGDGTCPYCLATVNCQHWTGLGWKKDT